MIEYLMNKWSEVYGSRGGLVGDTSPGLLYRDKARLRSVTTAGLCQDTNSAPFE